MRIIKKLKKVTVAALTVINNLLIVNSHRTYINHNIALYTILCDILFSDTGFYKVK